MSTQGGMLKYPLASTLAGPFCGQITLGRTQRDYKKNSSLQPAVETGCGMPLLSHLLLTAQGTGDDV